MQLILAFFKKLELPPRQFTSVQTHRIYIVKTLKKFKRGIKCIFCRNGSYHPTDMYDLVIFSEKHASLRDYFYRGAQRTDRELLHMVQRQSPEVQYQQNQWACGGLPEEQGEKWRGWTHTNTLGSKSLNNGQKYVFQGYYDVTMTLTFDLWGKKCHHFIILSY